MNKKAISSQLSPSVQQLFIAQLAASKKDPDLFAVPMQVQKAILKLALNAKDTKVLAALALLQEAALSILEELALERTPAIRIAFISRSFTSKTVHLLTKVLNEEKRASVFSSALKNTSNKTTFPQIFTAALKCFEEKPTVALAEFFSSSPDFKKSASLGTKLALYKLLTKKSLNREFSFHHEALAKELAGSSYASEAVLVTKHAGLFVFFFNSDLSTKAIDHIYAYFLKNKLLQLKNSAFYKREVSIVLEAAAAFKKAEYLPPELIADLTSLINTKRLGVTEQGIISNILDSKSTSDISKTLLNPNGKDLLDALQTLFSFSELADILPMAKALLKNPYATAEQRVEILQFLEIELQCSWDGSATKGIEYLKDLSEADKDSLYMTMYYEFTGSFSYQIYNDEEAAKLRLLKKAADMFIATKFADTGEWYDQSADRLNRLLSAGPISEKMLEILPAWFYLAADFSPEKLPYAGYLSALQDKYLGSDAKKWELFLSFLNSFEGTLGDLFNLIENLS